MVAIGLGLVLVALAGCAASSAEPTGTLEVFASPQTAAMAVTRVSIVITPASVSGDLSRAGETFQGSFSVPAGPQSVAATAWAGTNEVGTGTGAVTVQKAQTAALALTILDSTGPAPVPDHSPVVTSLSASSTAVNVGDQVAFSAVAIDVDNDPIGWSWSVAPAGCGSLSSTTTASVTLTAAQTGQCTVTATATANAKSDSKSITITASAAAPRNLTVDAAVTFQTIDGMGVNINVNSWNGGQLTPALDALVDVNGSSLFRVIRDPMTWVSSESLIAQLHALDLPTLRQVYETPAMQDIWNTIGYLGQKGVAGNQILLNFMGWTPTWIGGSGAFNSPSHITAGKEPQFATMVASLIYYGRKEKNLSFNLVSPLNEPDWNCLEGPCVSSDQMRTIMAALDTELNAMGLTDVRFVVPETAGAPDAYVAALSQGGASFARTDHLTHHAYGASRSPGQSFAGKNWWMTETAASCANCDTAGTPAQGEWAFARETADLVLEDLANGLGAVMVYDAYDSFYFHHDSDGFWGLLAFNSVNGTYTPRKRFYTNAQINRFIRPGARRIALTDSIATLTQAIATWHAASGKLTIVGHNSGASSITINGRLANVPVGITSLNHFQTNTGADMQQRPAVPVSSGNFAVTVPADTFFTLTN